MLLRPDRSAKMSCESIRTWFDMLLLRVTNIPELLGNFRQNLHGRRGPRPLPAADRSPLSGQTAVVTGANAGIGLDLSTALALRGAHVVMACRSAERGQAAAAAVRRQLHPPTSEDRQRLPAAPFGGQSPDTDGGSEGSHSAAMADGLSSWEVVASAPQQRKSPPISQKDAGGHRSQSDDVDSVALTGSVEFQQLDLGSLASVRDFAQRWHQRGPPPQLLFCNAGGLTACTPQ